MNKRFCPKCGDQIDDPSRVKCKNCGRPFEWMKEVRGDAVSAPQGPAFPSQPGMAGPAKQAKQAKQAGKAASHTDRRSGGRRWHKVVAIVLVAAIILAIGGYFAYTYLIAREKVTINLIKDPVTQPVIHLNTLFASDRTPVVDQKKNSYGYMNLDGELVIPCQYDEALAFNRDGLAVVQAAGEASDDDVNAQRFIYINASGQESFRSDQPNFVVNGSTLITYGEVGQPNYRQEKVSITPDQIVIDDRSPLTAASHPQVDPTKVIQQKLGVAPENLGADGTKWHWRALPKGLYQIDIIAGGKEYTGLLQPEPLALLAAVERPTDSVDRFVYEPLNKFWILTREASDTTNWTFFDESGTELLSTAVAGPRLASAYPDLSGNYWLVGKPGDMASAEIDRPVVVDILADKYPTAPVPTDLAVFVMDKSLTPVQIGTGFLPLRDPGASYTPLKDIVCVTNGQSAWYIHKDGSLLNDKTYARACPFSPLGLAYVETTDGKHGYIDITGEMVIDIGDCTGSSFFDDGYAIVRSKKGSQGVIDLEGKWVIPLQNKVSFAATHATEKDEELVPLTDPSFDMHAYQVSVLSAGERNAPAGSIQAGSPHLARTILCK